MNRLSLRLIDGGSTRITFAIPMNLLKTQIAEVSSAGRHRPARKNLAVHVSLSSYAIVKEQASQSLHETTPPPAETGFAIFALSGSEGGGFNSRADEWDIETFSDFCKRKNAIPLTKHLKAWPPLPPSKANARFLAVHQAHAEELRHHSLGTDGATAPETLRSQDRVGWTIWREAP